MTLENVPMLRNNEQMKILKQEESELEKNYSVIKNKIDKEQENEELKLEYEETKEKFLNIKDNIANFEKNVLEIENTFVQISGRDILSKRQINSKRYLDSGSIGKAMKLLPFDEIKEEGEEKVAGAERLKPEAQVNVNELIQRAETIKLNIDNPKRFKEIEKIYDAAFKIEVKARLARTALERYAKYLLERKDYKKGFKAYELLVYYKTLLGERIVPQLYREYAICCMYVGKYFESKKNFLRALKEYELKIEKENYFINKDLTLLEIAILNNDLSLLYIYAERYDEAEKYAKHAIEISDEISNQELVVIPILMITYSHLCSSYMKEQKNEIARECGLKSLKLMEVAYKENPNLYAIMLSTLYNNLTTIYMNLGQYNEAEEYAMKNIKITQKLIDKQPEKYKNERFIVCENVSLLYQKMGVFDMAERYKIEAIELTEMLMKKSPHVYEQQLITLYNDMIDLYEKAGNKKKKREWKEKLEELTKDDDEDE